MPSKANLQLRCHRCFSLLQERDDSEQLVRELMRKTKKLQEEQAAAEQSLKVGCRLAYLDAAGMSRPACLPYPHVSRIGTWLKCQACLSIKSMCTPFGHVVHVLQSFVAAAE